MKTTPKLFFALTAVAALSVAYPAKADTITTFNVSGTCIPTPPFTGTTFSGTLTIDVTTGTITAIGVSFLGLSAFNTISTSTPIGTSDWRVVALDGLYALNLDFTTGHTPGSLVGFTGGTINGDRVFPISTGLTAYFITNGSITAPAGVPDTGSTLPLLGFASLGLAALRRKLSC